MSNKTEALPPLPERAKKLALFLEGVFVSEELSAVKAREIAKCLRELCAALVQRQQVPDVRLEDDDALRYVQRVLESDATREDRTRARDEIVKIRTRVREYATTAAPSAQAEPVAPFLFVAMDDDKKAHLTWCADQAAVREAVKGAMFWAPNGEELDADNLRQLDGVVEELLDSGAMIFEGDAPLYLYRVAAPPAAQAEPQEPLPTILFDGYAVYQALDKKAQSRTSTENVSDVLDAVVRLLRGIGKQED